MYYTNTLIKTQDIAASKRGRETKRENHFAGFSSLVFFLRGWGGVFSSRRKTSSNLGSVTPSLRGSFSVISWPSKEIEEKTKLLLQKIRDVYLDTLAPYEGGSPYADKVILRVVLSYLLKNSLTSPEKTRKVLRYLR